MRVYFVPLLHVDLRHTEEKQEKPGRAALPRGQSDPLLLDSKEVLLIGPLKVLDWSDSAKPKRIPCKLVLLVEMGIHKLEVYIPPKVGHGNGNQQLRQEGIIGITSSRVTIHCGFWCLASGVVCLKGGVCLYCWDLKQLYTLPCW